ncbi:von Willebrand domain containing [Cordyceps militaris]|uniref:von Willebrand domain containing n=1 Tax=Cordyceps militaris TaxID=73501 RepID=A0A2H4SFY9_CORMI|nr:von Willebrand domain containing [Cordyceps militaris]
MSRFGRPPLHAGINSGYCGCLVVIKNEPKYLPLTHVSAHATLLASTSRTTLTQTFKNPTAHNLTESRYVFPLFDGVSIVAFTCTVGSTVIRGVVKSRPDATKAFVAAVARGEQAGLLEQSGRASDVFTTTLGNVGPGQEAKVEIVFLGELKHDAEVDGLRYTLPTHIAPRYAEDLLVPLPAHRSNVLTAAASLTVTVDVDLATGAAIRSVQSPSHPIAVRIGTTSTRPDAEPSLQHASASLTRADVALDRDFVVHVCAKGLGDPSAVLETHATLPDRRALMATLVPRFPLAVETPEVVFICDRSGSMDTGTRLPNLVAALHIFLKSLPVGVLFNVCSFGSSHSFLWPKSQPYNQATLDAAAAHVAAFAANFGGTRIREPIKATFAQRDPARNLEVFLMTDGETWDEDATFAAVNRAVDEAKGAIRLFALGIGADASHSLIEGVARAGRGFAQSVGEDENMTKKVVRMLKGALTPHVNDYSLEIKYEKGDDDEFELVEKVSACAVVDSGEQPAAAKKPAAPIPLHDAFVKDQDLEMPDVQALPLPTLPTPAYLQAPYTIPPLFPFSRTTVFVLLSAAHAHRTAASVILRGTAPQGPLVLEIPITALSGKGTTVHQLAARKAVQDLEEGRGWIYDATLPNGTPLREAYAMRIKDVARDAAVQLGVEYQVAGKWCSFVAVKKVGDEADEDLDVVLVDANDATVTRRASGRARGPMCRKMAAAPPPPAPAVTAASFGGASSFAFGAASTSASFGLGSPQSASLMSAPAFGSAGAGSSSAFGASSSGGLFGSAQPANSAGLSDDASECLPSSPGGPSLFASPVTKAAVSVNLFGRPAPAPSSQPAFGQQQPSSPKQTPLEAVIALQTFSGSWTWSGELTRLLGVTEAAAVHLGVVAEATATLCAVAYLQKTLPDEEEVWELVVDKARGWLAATLGVAEEEVRVLEGKARELV